MTSAWLQRMHARALDQIKGADDRALLQRCSLRPVEIGGWPLVQLLAPDGCRLQRAAVEAYMLALKGVLVQAVDGLDVVEALPDATDPADGLPGLWQRISARMALGVRDCVALRGARITAVTSRSLSLSVPAGRDLPAADVIAAIEAAAAEVLGQRVSVTARSVG